MREEHSRRLSAVTLVLAIAIAAGLLAPGLKADAQVEPTLISAGGLRILVVESSEQQVTVDPGRAGELNADNPDWFLLRFDIVDDSAQVDRLTASLTSVDLGSYDIVVIPCPTAGGLSPQESDAITAFLTGGGGLLLIGYGGCGRGFGALGGELGFSFDGVGVAVSEPLLDSYAFWLPEVVAHQVTSGIDGIQVTGSGSFTFEEGWQVLARTGADAWLDSETNGKRDPDEITGPFDSLGVRDFGDGRVVAIADSLTFRAHSYPWKLPAKVAGNILAWLAGANVFTAPPAGGVTQSIAGTTSLQSLIVAQTFEVESVWKFDIATQVFEVYVPGAPLFANTLKSLGATDIVSLKSK